MPRDPAPPATAASAAAAAAPNEAGLAEADLAAALATEAGELLVQLRAQSGSLEPRELKDLGDARAQELLAARLGELRPGDAVLSEEALDDPARLRADRVWIVDPLDGTREYGEPPRTDWAVHVALWERTGPGTGELTAGAVALPAQGRTLSSTSPGAPAVRPNGRPLRMVVSRTRAPEMVQAVARQLGAELVPLGSAGAKTMAVVLGDADIYLHAGGQYEWDSAAPVAVARAAGLHTSRIDGSPLVYNRPDPLLPDLLVCPPELAARVLDAVAAQQGASPGPSPAG